MAHQHIQGHSGALNIWSNSSYVEEMRKYRKISCKIKATELQ